MAASADRSLEDLKSLVVHTLETNGVLGEIRAQLRANVYKAIEHEEDKSVDQATSSGSRLMKSPSGRLLAEIVAEFFEFYELRHSLSVFVPESTLGRERRSRTDVALDAGVGRLLSDASILEQVLGLANSSDVPKGGVISSASSTTASSPFVSDLPRSHVSTGGHPPDDRAAHSISGESIQSDGSGSLDLTGGGAAAASAASPASAPAEQRSVPASPEACSPRRPDDDFGDEIVDEVEDEASLISGGSMHSFHSDANSSADKF